MTPALRNMLHTKRLLITGVVDSASIAHAITVSCLHEGAHVVLAAPPRDLERTLAAAEPLGLDTIQLDVTDPQHWADARRILGERHGVLHGAVHAVAYAPADALDGSMLDTDPSGLDAAFQTSVASYAWLAKLLRGLAPPDGASLVGLHFDAARAWPTYNWMGVCKAALATTNQYLARDLASSNIRANLIAAGPLHTRAASGIPGFSLLLDAWDRQAPLDWDPTDPSPVADAACFLLSDQSRATTGEILHVDAGFHAIATTLASSDQPHTSALNPTP